MKTKIEILEEMVAHFATNQRAMDGLDCVYLTEDDKRCGHSIFIEDEMLANIDREASAEILITKYGDEIYKPEYRGHSVYFWIDVQTLHDIDGYWQPNAKGGHDLTEGGRLYFEELKNKWK